MAYAMSHLKYYVWKILEKS